MKTTLFISLSIAAYLIGSIPIGYLVAKARGVDIRKVGSGNIGSTNITRNLGFKWGAIVAALDFCKGYFPVVIASQFNPSPTQLLAISLMPILGHIFSVFLGFKGGKGVAATFGLMAFYFGFPNFLLFAFIWYLAVKYIKLMSLVNLVVGLLLPVVFWLIFKSTAHALFGGVLCVLIWWSHRSNIKRLLTGTELQTNY